MRSWRSCCWLLPDFGEWLAGSSSLYWSKRRLECAVYRKRLFFGKLYKWGIFLARLRARVRGEGVWIKHLQRDATSVDANSLAFACRFGRKNIYIYYCASFWIFTHSEVRLEEDGVYSEHRRQSGAGAQQDDRQESAGRRWKGCPGGQASAAR